MKNNRRSVWLLIEMALHSPLVRTMLIYGPPGTGKTYVAIHVGRVRDGVYCVTLTEETTAAELRGHFIFKGGDAIWHDGPFTRAMREGRRLVINEISHASADVLALLFPLLESWETARLTLPTGETVQPAPGFHVVATDNQPPDHLPEPLRDRFMATMRVTDPHPDALAGLREDLRGLAEAAAVINDGRQISIRGWTNLEKLWKEFGLHDACRLVFGPDRGEMIYDAIRLALSTRKTTDGGERKDEDREDDEAYGGGGGGPGRRAPSP